jgi:AbiTii
MGDVIRETVGDIEDAILPQGIGMLEGLASQGTDMHRIGPPWSSVMIDTLNQFYMPPNSRVREVYWSVPNASILGILVRVRTALADLVAELIVLTPQDQAVPDKQAADQVVQFVITGDRAVINYSPQHATGSGTNVTVAGHPAPGPVTVSGAQGSAIGSQTASGANSSVVGTQAANGAGASAVGSQAVHGGGDAVVARAGCRPYPCRRRPRERRLVGAAAEARCGCRVCRHHHRYRRCRGSHRRDSSRGWLEAVK